MTGGNKIKMTFEEITLEELKAQNPILGHPQTTIIRRFHQVYDGKMYIVFEYITPLGSNFSFHTKEGMVKDVIKYHELLMKLEEVLRL
jgi:hypothetical protein